MNMAVQFIQLTRISTARNFFCFCFPFVSYKSSQGSCSWQLGKTLGSWPLMTACIMNPYMMNIFGLFPFVRPDRPDHSCHKENFTVNNNYNQSIIPSTDLIQLTLAPKMTTTQVVKTSVTVNNNSPIQDYVHPDDQTQPTFEMTPRFKPFTIKTIQPH